MRASTSELEALLTWSRDVGSLIGAQKATSTKGCDILVPRPRIRGIPEIMVCRILMFMWSFGPLIDADCPSFFGLALGDGHVPTSWLLRQVDMSYCQNPYTLAKRHGCFARSFTRPSHNCFEDPDARPDDGGDLDCRSHEPWPSLLHGNHPVVTLTALSWEGYSYAHPN